jgi:hypothetical protein
LAAGVTAVVAKLVVETVVGSAAVVAGGVVAAVVELGLAVVCRVVAWDSVVVSDPVGSSSSSTSAESPEMRGGQLGVLGQISGSCLHSHGGQ